MTKEHNQRRLSRVGEAYGLTEREDLFDRMTGTRFLAILSDEQTKVHEISVDSNNYGEFLFVATSRGNGDKQVCVTFYGLGFHEYRERWFTDEWRWYDANAIPDRLKKIIPKEEAQRQIEERRQEIAAYITDEPQSRQGVLFEMLADLTDEDGAFTELEDLGDSVDRLFGDSDE